MFTMRPTTLSLSTLLAASPLLQDLTIKLNYSDLVYLDNNAGKFNILVLVPTLKLVLECGFDLWSYKHHIIINTPALEYLNFRGYLVDNDVLENLPNLSKSEYFMFWDVFIQSGRGTSWNPWNCG